ncbi:MAG: hypothetical protein HN380_17490 [Victivallales bacterium]|nr:hypothetical protein [Victivallales bacterium]
MTGFRRIPLGLILLLLLPSTGVPAQGGEAFLTTAWWKRMEFYQRGKDHQVLVPTEQQIQFAWSDQPFAVHIPFHMRLQDVDGHQYTPRYILKYYVSGFGPYEEVDTVDKFKEKWYKKQDAEEKARPKTEEERQAERERNDPPAEVKPKKEPRKAHFRLGSSSIGMYRLDGQSLSRTEDYPLRWYESAESWRNTYSVENIDDASEWRREQLKEGKWPHTLKRGIGLSPASPGKAAFFLTFDPRKRLDGVHMWDYVGEKAEGIFHYQVEEEFRDPETDAWKQKVIAEGELEITVRQNGFQVQRIETGRRGWWGRVSGDNKPDETTEFLEGEPKAVGSSITFESTLRRARGTEKLADKRLNFSYKGPAQDTSTMQAKIRVPSRMYDHVRPIFLNQQFLTTYDKMAGRWDRSDLEWIKIYTYRYDREEIDRQLDRMAVLYGKNDPTSEDDDQGRQTARDQDEDDGDDEDEDDDDDEEDPDAALAAATDVLFTPVPGLEPEEHAKRLQEAKKRAHAADYKDAIAQPVEIQNHPDHRNIKGNWTWEDNWAAPPRLHGSSLDRMFEERQYKGVLAFSWTASHPAPTHRLFRVVYHCDRYPAWADQYADVYVARLSDLADNRAGGPGPAAGSSMASQIDPGIQDWYDEHYTLVDDARSTITAAMASLGRLGKQRDRLRARETKLLELMMGGFRFERDEQAGDLVESAWQWYRDGWQESDYLNGESSIRTDNMESLSNAVLGKLRKDRAELGVLVGKIEKMQKAVIDAMGPEVDKVIAHYPAAIAKGSWHRKKRLETDRTFWTDQKQTLLAELYDAAGWYEQAAKHIDLKVFKGDEARSAMALMRAKLAGNIAEKHHWKARLLQATNQPEAVKKQMAEVTKRQVEALEALREVASIQPGNEGIKRQVIGLELKLLGMVAAKLENEKRLSFGAFAAYMKDRGFEMDQEDTWWNTLKEWKGLWWGTGPVSYASAFTGRVDMLGQTATIVNKEVAQYHVGLMVIKRLRQKGMPLKDMVEIEPDTLGKWLHLETSVHVRLPGDKVAGLAADVRAVFRDVPEVKALAEPGNEGEFAVHYGFGLYEPLFTAANIENFSDFFNLWNVSSTVWPCAVTKIGGRWQTVGAWRSVTHRMGTLTYSTGARFGYTAEAITAQDSLITGLRLKELAKGIEKLPGGTAILEDIARDAAILNKMGTSGGRAMRAAGTVRYGANQVGRVFAFMVVYAGLPEVVDENVLKHLPFNEYTSPAFAFFIHALAELSVLEEGYELLAGMNTRISRIMPHVLKGEKLAKRIKATYSKRYRMMDDLERAIDEMEQASKGLSKAKTFDVGQNVHPSDVNRPGGGTPRTGGDGTPVVGTGGNTPGGGTARPGGGGTAAAGTGGNRPSDGGTPRIDRDAIEKEARNAKLKENNDRLTEMAGALGPGSSGGVIGLELGTIPAEAMRRAVSLARNGQYKAARKALRVARRTQKRLDGMADSLLDSISTIKKNANRMSRPRSPAGTTTASGPFKTPGELKPAGDFDPSSFIGSQKRLPGPDDVFSYRPKKYWDDPSGAATQRGDEALHASGEIDSGKIDKALDQYRKALDEARAQQWSDVREGAAVEAFLEHRINQVRAMQESGLVLKSRRQTEQALDVTRAIEQDEVNSVVERVRTDLKDTVKELGDFTNPESMNPVFLIKDADGTPAYVFKPCKDSPSACRTAEDDVTGEAFGSALINESGMGRAAAVHPVALDVGPFKHGDVDYSGVQYGVIVRYVPGKPLKDLPLDVVMALRKEWAEHITIRYILGDYDGHLGNCILGDDGIFYDIDTGLAATGRAVGVATLGDQAEVVRQVAEELPERFKSRANYAWIEQMNSLVGTENMLDTVNKFRSFLAKDTGGNFKKLLRKKYRRPKKGIRGRKDPPVTGDWIRDADNRVVHHADGDGEWILGDGKKIKHMKDPNARIYRDAKGHVEWREPSDAEIEDLYKMYQERVDEVEKVITKPDSKFSDETGWLDLRWLHSDPLFPGLEPITPPVHAPASLCRAAA